MVAKGNVQSNMGFNANNFRSSIPMTIEQVLELLARWYRRNATNSWNQEGHGTKMNEHNGNKQQAQIHQEDDFSRPLEYARNISQD